MIILVLRTDNPDSEIGFYEDDRCLEYKVWTAHRELSSTIHKKLRTLMDGQGLLLDDIGGIVVYEGPGSFTGLRIGMSVANALAYVLQIPIAATTGETWIHDGIAQLSNGQGMKIALPEYGAPVHITAPKH